MPLHKIAVVLLVLSCCGWAGLIPVGDYSFENPNLGAGYEYRPTGIDWNFTGSAGIAADGSGFNLDDPAFGSVPAPDGSQVGFLQYNTSPSSGSDPGTISQTLTGFVQGETYAVTFYAANRPDAGLPPLFYGGEQNFGVYWDGVEIEFIDGATDLNANDTFKEFTATFTASAADALSGGTLEFAVDTLNGPSGDRTDFIDDVQVSDPPSAPEPSSVFTVLSGIGLIGLGLRRRFFHSR